MSFIPRLFIEDILFENKEIQIIDKQFHYLINVLKKTLNDEIYLINGKDGEFLSIIIEINKKKLVLKIEKKTKDFYKQNFLGLIIPPIQKIDIVLKSSTEIGVTDFYFIKTDFSNKDIKFNKINGNIIEAIEQSERLDFPNVHKLDYLENLLSILNKKDNIIIFCEERRNNNLFKNKINLINKNNNIFVLIGPEGGFSRKEKDLINSYNNVISISLGTNILRTETATISILSLIKNLILN